MKVLHIIGGLQQGGVERVAINLYKEISNENIQIDFLVADKKEGYYEREITTKIHRTSSSKDDIFSGRFNACIYVWELYRIIRNEKYNVIHCHNNNFALLSMIVGKVLGVKVRIIHNHNASTIRLKDSYMNRILIEIYSFMLGLFSTHCISCSEIAEKFLFNNVIGKKKKCKVIYNGIDFNVFKQTISKKEAKVQNKMRQSDKIILFVGRISNIKNPLFALKVFKRLNEMRNDVKFIMISNVNFEDKQNKLIYEEMISYIKENELKDKVIISEFRNDIQNIMALSDILILPSLYEGLSLVAIEAQRMEMQVFLSDTISKEIDGGRCTYLSLKDSVYMWAERINTYLEKDEIMNLNEDCMNRFNKNYMAQQFEQIYKGD